MAASKKALAIPPLTQGLLAIGFLGGGFLHYLAVTHDQPTASTSATQTASQSASQTAAQMAAQIAQQVAASRDPFRDGVNHAQKAAQAAQSAKTPQQWANVAYLWQTASALMKAVPSTHPRLTIAQTKTREYAQNHLSAQARAGSATFASALPAVPTKPAVPAKSATVPSSPLKSATSPKPIAPKIASKPGSPKASTGSTGSGTAGATGAIVPAQANLGAEANSPLRPEFLLLGAAGLLGFLVLDIRIPFLTKDNPKGKSKGQSNGRPKGQLDAKGRRRGEAAPRGQSIVATPEPSRLESLKQVAQFQGQRLLQRFGLELKAKAAIHPSDEPGASNPQPTNLVAAEVAARKVQRKVYRRLLAVTPDEGVAIQLLKVYLARHPDHSADWCCEKAIEEAKRRRSQTQ